MKSKLLLGLALVLGIHCHAAIIFPEAPKEGWQLACDKIKSGLQTDPQFYKGLKIEDLTITNALKAYDFSPQDVVSNNMLSSAKFHSWQYLLGQGTDVVFSVWTPFDPDGKLRKPSGVSEGDFFKSILVGLQKAQALPQVQKQDYECRYLNSPFLFHAIWLHGKSNDIIIPLPPTWNEWNAYQPYSEREITTLLKPEAVQKIKMREKYPGRPE